QQLSTSESEMSSIKSELEIVQRALRLQTRRCRQLVAEYTRRLQEKEQQYQSEKLLRDSQLTKVLRALLIFEARLKQEQKYISHQLKEKDYIIKRQCDDISKLSNQYCKHCNQFYSPVRNLESLDSSSEYVGTDYQDYQSSNVESLDSSSETYATISEKDFPKLEEKLESEGKIYQKNKMAIKRGRKIGHRKSVGTYFEVLKLRKDAVSPSSNDDNTSNDYENLESLPAESISGKISTVSERIEKAFADNLTEDNLDKHDNQFVLEESRSEEEETLQNVNEEKKSTDEETENNLINETLELSKSQEDEKVSKITESIPVFEADEGETNDNWYASASDQEDDEQRDVYRNNPVLECMNQILMQNINDNPSTPPKSPTVERRQAKNNNKRVKFSDEDLVHKENLLNAENLNYYETPIQKAPNFYETPQSIYSNDYEQILSKCNESFVHPIPEKPQKPEPTEPPHYYIDMDPNQTNPTKKTKILRTPPALPPKPANLLSKYKLQNLPKSPDKSTTPSIDSEPDYCSISELNLPTKAKKLTVVAEINIPNESIKTSEKHIILHSPKQKDCKAEKAKPLVVVVNKSVEKLNIQVAKQTPIKTESPTKPKPKVEQEIPMLPQVSEIIIPEEVESSKIIAHDNYIKNNSQMLKTKPETARRSILIGTSVSSLITGFNNQQLLSEIHSKSPKGKLNKKMFASFESLQNIEKQSKPAEKSPDDSHDFAKFDLSQNFEEFKLDDCEIEEYNVDNNIDTEEVIAETKEEDEDDEEETQEEHVLPDILTTPTKMSSTRVELVRATNDVSVPTLNQATIQQLKKKLELDKSKEVYQSTTVNNGSEPSYEHFLECTGLSSKSILTPSRLLSNHKSMLKPKDVKLRSKVKSNVLDKQSNTIKYWSEPYI
ncbi:PREDICTED: uncharacterized protein LOC108557985, partial [Nicrophorus vespilloides]|uniref:Uncharacterized protein LOC108557985 n=1 Tax=Nicrophorus vespilloides TaxID=110193 RepID=A0ABM1M6N4_NICVS